MNNSQIRLDELETNRIADCLHISQLRGYNWQGCRKRPEFSVLHYMSCDKEILSKKCSRVSSISCSIFHFGAVYVKLMVSKINCQSVTAFCVMPQSAPISFFFYYYQGQRLAPFLPTIKTADFKIDPFHPNAFYFNLLLHQAQGRSFALVGIAHKAARVSVMTNRWGKHE